MKFLSKSPKETQKAAGVLAKKITRKTLQKRTALVLGLEGELGAGKTTFVKGFAKGLGLKNKISSPTFVLIKSYNLKLTTYNNLFHIDAYRLKDHEDLIRLGIKEIFSNPKNLILIEWSDRVRKILPKNYLRIHIDHIDENERKIVIENDK
ncbi:MAG: tRNA (adenosine(37)-N6)-threonylcarbamoyltransferase complex ATPase subunit type 1 TsaE [Candidatus Yanofskybacteria bacterium]|nr:tRNA (adenosine(37)-N6)-threonylcarbamoyltransferase complex ATPase subunit type 1 TsaE [Candidatus Yanofskybacteria bacterium]